MHALGLGAVGLASGLVEAAECAQRPHAQLASLVCELALRVVAGVLFGVGEGLTGVAWQGLAARAEHLELDDDCAGVAGLCQRLALGEAVRLGWPRCARLTGDASDADDRGRLRGRDRRDRLWCGGDARRRGDRVSDDDG